MNVLTVFAHHSHNSFCHALLERFDTGLRDAGHTNEVVDLHAIRFNPVLTDQDNANWLDEDVPDDVLAGMQLRERVLREAHNPVSKVIARRMLRDRDDHGIVALLHDRPKPKDVLEQQEKVARAQALAFVAPVYFVGFPAILKGWIERVFTLGFAFDLHSNAWRGDIHGRIPLLRHEKALILQTTLFDEPSYQGGLADSMKALIDEFGFRYPGIQKVEHVYFYAVHGASDETRRRYLEQAYGLGRDF
jgi:NAD(P)H dehydrogenase (quinone)